MKWLTWLLFFLVGCSVAEASEEMPKGYRESKLPAVQAMPPIYGYWSNNPHFGISTPINNFTGSFSDQKVLDVPEIGAPKIRTVSLGFDAPVDAFGTGVATNIAAIINFGSGGAFQRVEIDWADGASITLPCNTLTVFARIINVGTLPNNVTLSVLFAEGTFEGPPSFRSIFFLAPAGGSSARFRVPPFARYAFVVPSFSAANNIYVAGNNLNFFFNSVDATTSESVRLLDLLTMGSMGIPIGIDSKFFEVSNAGGVDIAGRVIFSLGV